MIEPSVAAADGASRRTAYANVTIDRGSPKAGYIFRAFADQTDRSRFAFMAAPDARTAGRSFFIVNADNTIWAFDLPRSYRVTFAAIDGCVDSTSTIRGTGRPELDDATTFPANPSGAKWD